jgi:hypothetical protein
MLTHPVRVLVNAKTVQGGMALVRIQDPDQQAEGGSLARTVRPYEAKDLPGFHVQVDAGDGRDLLESLVQVTGFK